MEIFLSVFHVVIHVFFQHMHTCIEWLSESMDTSKPFANPALQKGGTMPHLSLMLCGSGLLWSWLRINYSTVFCVCWLVGDMLLKLLGWGGGWVECGMERIKEKQVSECCIGKVVLHTNTLIGCTPSLLNTGCTHTTLLYRHTHKHPHSSTHTPSFLNSGCVHTPSSWTQVTHTHPRYYTQAYTLLILAHLTLEHSLHTHTHPHCWTRLHPHTPEHRLHTPHPTPHSWTRVAYIHSNFWTEVMHTRLIVKHRLHTPSFLHTNTFILELGLHTHRLHNHHHPSFLNTPTFILEHRLHTPTPHSWTQLTPSLLNTGCNPHPAAHTLPPPAAHSWTHPPSFLNSGCTHIVIIEHGLHPHTHTWTQVAHTPSFLNSGWTPTHPHFWTQAASPHPSFLNSGCTHTPSLLNTGCTHTHLMQNIALIFEKKQHNWRLVSNTLKWCDPNVVTCVVLLDHLLKCGRVCPTGWTKHLCGHDGWCRHTRIQTCTHFPPTITIKDHL